jgi:hypothetical protein
MSKSGLKMVIIGMIIYWQGNWLLCSNTLSPHTGLLPPVWCDAILCAVFKKGDPSVYDNYRGIAVGALMGKIYSMIVEARLDRFCEAHGYRATGQAGFRRKRACSDHVFILKHLIDRTRADARRNLFVCFVDFRKAYDMVRRDLMMECLDG